MKDKEITGIIYCATFPNGKKYVGQTTQTLGSRKSDHRNKAREKYEPTCKFKNAIKKYGFDDITWEILETVPIQDLNKKEIYYIKKLDTYINGYNSDLGGQGRRTIPLETINKIRSTYANQTLKQLSETFCLNKTTIRKILKNEIYQDPQYTPPESDFILRGDRVSYSKLTKKQVNIIRKKFIEGEVSCAELAKAYDVDYCTIYALLENKHWYDPDYIPPENLSSWRSKFTKDQVIGMRALYLAGEHPKIIANKYNTTVKSIDKILKNKRCVDQNYTPPNIDRRRVLTEQQIKNIRKMYLSGYTKQEIAEVTGLAFHNVRNVVENRTCRDPNYQYISTVEKGILPPSTKTKIVNLYLAGFSLAEISEITCLDEMKISDVIEKKNLPRPITHVQQKQILDLEKARPKEIAEILDINKDIVSAYLRHKRTTIHDK